LQKCIRNRRASQTGKSVVILSGAEALRSEVEGPLAFPP
jgi:hypothetical protein